jgi:hypothetical protein
MSTRPLRACCSLVGHRLDPTPHHRVSAGGADGRSLLGNEMATVFRSLVGPNISKAISAL